MAQYLSSNHWGLLVEFWYWSMIAIATLLYNPVWWLSWWRHQMEIFSALLALCAGNSPAIAEFPSQRTVTRSFGVFCDLRLSKRLQMFPSSNFNKISDVSGGLVCKFERDQLIIHKISEQCTNINAPLAKCVQHLPNATLQCLIDCSVSMTKWYYGMETKKRLRALKSKSS